MKRPVKRPVKRPLALLALACSLAAAAPAKAEDSFQPPANEAGAGMLSGLGAGGVAGALIGGPVGLPIGAFIGSLLGAAHDAGQEKTTAAARLAAASQQLHQTRLALAVDRAELAEVRLRAARASTPAPMIQPVAAREPIPESELAANRAGLALAQNIAITVQFRSGQDGLEPHFRDQLARLAGALNPLGRLSVHLTGHADRRGEADFNRDLSERRVSAVRQLLTEAGLPEERIHHSALGEAQPLSDEGDLSGYAFDRRVTVRFLVAEEGEAAL